MKKRVFSADSLDGRDLLPQVIAGIMARLREITAFLNPTDNSYLRLGSRKAPGYISWSSENHSQLIRIPAAPGLNKRLELRSADPGVNPYTQLQGAYLSVAEALRHAGYARDTHVEIRWIDSETLASDNVGEKLKGLSGIPVPGGFGNRGIEGMILAAQYA